MGLRTPGFKVSMLRDEHFSKRKLQPDRFLSSSQLPKVAAVATGEGSVGGVGLNRRKEPLQKPLS